MQAGLRCHIVLPTRGVMSYHVRHSNAPPFVKQAEMLACVTKRNFTRMLEIVDGDKDSFDCIRSEQFPETPLIVAVNGAAVDLVLALVKFGANVSVTDRTGRTPLLLAIEHSSDAMCPVEVRASFMRIIECLLANGADPAPADGSQPPLVAACSAPRGTLDQVVDHLLAIGADVGQRDSGGRTALCQAVRSDNCTVAMMLLQRGADPNAESESGLTPLAAALSNAGFQMITLLLRWGANVSALTRDALLSEREKRSGKESEIVAVIRDHFTSRISNPPPSRFPNGAYEQDNRTGLPYSNGLGNSMNSQLPAPRVGIADLCDNADRPDPQSIGSHSRPGTVARYGRGNTSGIDKHYVGYPKSAGGPRHGLFGGVNVNRDTGYSFRGIASGHSSSHVGGVGENLSTSRADSSNLMDPRASDLQATGCTGQEVWPSSQNVRANPVGSKRDEETRDGTRDANRSRSYENAFGAFSPNSAQRTRARTDPDLGRGVEQRDSPVNHQLPSSCLTPTITGSNHPASLLEPAAVGAVPPSYPQSHPWFNRGVEEIGRRLASFVCAGFEEKRRAEKSELLMSCAGRFCLNGPAVLSPATPRELIQAMLRDYIKNRGEDGLVYASMYFVERVRLNLVDTDTSDGQETCFREPGDGGVNDKKKCVENVVCQVVPADELVDGDPVLPPAARADMKSMTSNLRNSHALMVSGIDAVAKLWAEMACAGCTSNDQAVISAVLHRNAMQFGLNGPALLSPFISVKDLADRLLEERVQGIGKDGVYWSTLTFIQVARSGQTW